MNIVIVNGYPESGKTTFEKISMRLLKNNGYSKSSIDFVKKIATQCGWNGDKTPENRKFLSDLKKLLTDWDNVPLHQLCYEISSIQFKYDIWDIPTDKVVVFVDVREPAEIDKYKKYMEEEYHWNVTTLFIRAVVDHNFSNTSDSNVENYNYDCYINNDKTGLDKLEEKAKEFLRYLNVYKKED